MTNIPRDIQLLSFPLIATLAAGRKCHCQMCIMQSSVVAGCDALHALRLLDMRAGSGGCEDAQILSSG